MENADVSLLLARIDELEARLNRKRGKYKKRKADPEKVQAILARLTEAENAYKQAIAVEKEARRTAQMSKAQMQDLLVLARRNKIAGKLIAEALDINVKAVYSRVKNAKKTK